MRNAAQCLNCGEIVESKHRHDFVSCSCWEAERHKETPEHGIFVDGGLDYYRYGYAKESEFKSLHIYGKDDEKSRRQDG